jgi:hypothetical protein
MLDYTLRLVPRCSLCGAEESSGDRWYQLPNGRLTCRACAPGGCVREDHPENYLRERTAAAYPVNVVAHDGYAESEIQIQPSARTVQSPSGPRTLYEQRGEANAAQFSDGTVSLLVARVAHDGAGGMSFASTEDALALCLSLYEAVAALKKP